MAGPLSALDMEAQFKPAPFGAPPPLSALQQVLTESPGLWDSFRTIEDDKERKVLEVLPWRQ